MKTPFYKDLSDEALRSEYRGLVELSYNNANMAAYGVRSQLARQMGRLMKNRQIIEAIARQRGIRL